MAAREVAEADADADGEGEAALALLVCSELEDASVLQSGMMVLFVDFFFLLLVTLSVHTLLLLEVVLVAFLVDDDDDMRIVTNDYFASKLSKFEFKLFCKTQILWDFLSTCCTRVKNEQ